MAFELFDRGRFWSRDDPLRQNAVINSDHLRATPQRQAAEVSLENAKTVAEDAKARLVNGLATKPDELEAIAERTQADYDLQAAVGTVRHRSRRS